MNNNEESFESINEKLRKEIGTIHLTEENQGFILYMIKNSLTTSSNAEFKFIRDDEIAISLNVNGFTKNELLLEGTCNELKEFWVKIEEQTKTMCNDFKVLLSKSNMTDVKVHYIISDFDDCDSVLLEVVDGELKFSVYNEYEKFNSLLEEHKVSKL